MTISHLPKALAVFVLLSCAACAAGGDSGGGSGGGTGGGGTGGGGGGGGTPPDPTNPPDEVVNVNYDELSNRTAPGLAAMSYVVLDGQTPISEDTVTMLYSSGAITGGVLDMTDLDDATFLNPANGEFSRIVRISGSNLFGVVGLDVLAGDLPPAGSVTSYNEGWVGMTAAFENEVLVLEGDAEFTATWDTNDIDGRFFNLSGTNSGNGNVTNVGTIVLTNGVITDDNFTGGSVSGTGVFAQLGGGGTSSDTGGTFFGPQADELGGVILINDATDDILVVGAFQAD